MTRWGISAALALSVGLVGTGTMASAHQYDNSSNQPDKTIDGAATLTPGEDNGVPGYWVEYNRYLYRDISGHYHEYEKGLQEIEKAYCKKPEEFGSDDDVGVDCGVTVDENGKVVSKTGSQDSLYSGDVSPHAQGIRVPKDQQEFASYLSAATNGFNNGQNGNLNQNQALAGTRLSQVTDQKQFDAAVARMYVFQFSAAANGEAANTVDGMAKGAQDFYKMSPAAQEFLQVAAVFKGRLATGTAGNYNNGKLAALLRQKAPTLANRTNVGNTDVETLGAIAAALNQGLITLDDVMQSGGVANNEKARYAAAIDSVNSGTFALKLAAYDRSAFNPNSRAKGNRNANTGNNGLNAPGSNVNQKPASLGKYFEMLAIEPSPSKVQQLADSDAVFRALLEVHDLNGVGRIYGEGEVKNFVASMRCFSELLQDGARELAGLTAHDSNHLSAFDVNNDGHVDDEELNSGLEKVEIFTAAVVADAKTQTGGIAPGGFACTYKPPKPKPTPAPAAPPPPPTPPKTGY